MIKPQNSEKTSGFSGFLTVGQIESDVKPITIIVNNAKMYPTYGDNCELRYAVTATSSV